MISGEEEGGGGTCAPLRWSSPTDTCFFYISKKKISFKVVKIEVKYANITDLGITDSSQSYDNEELFFTRTIIYYEWFTVVRQ